MSQESVHSHKSPTGHSKGQRSLTHRFDLCVSQWAQMDPDGSRWIQMGDPQVCLQRDENRQICDLNDDWGSPITEQHQQRSFKPVAIRNIKQSMGLSNFQVQNLQNTLKHNTFPPCW